MTDQRVGRILDSMASWTHEAVFEEAERRAATALVNLVADPSPPARAELERQLDNMRAAGLVISRTGATRNDPRTLASRYRSERVAPSPMPGEAVRGQVLWLLSVLGLAALAWLVPLALVLVTV